MRSFPGIALGVGMLVALAAAGGRGDPAADADEALLKQAKIATEGP
jgi:hypothetical protein